MTNRHLALSEEVAAAIGANRAVVALESAILTHGMPHPRNVETALAVQADIAERGATPATIAILDGRIRVGLTADEIDRLGRAGSRARKVSRRDVAFLIEDGGDGGTTVAATMLIADLAGIDVFATGGIGGVHRGGAASFDVSADLEELARSNVAVVCAGMKSILDVGLTLQYLETRGVPVIGYQTDVLPGFYSRETDFPVDYRLDSAAAVAEVMRIRRELSIGGGIVVANPIPAEDGMDRTEVEAAINRALADAIAQGIAGKDMTPYLLERLVDLTAGASLDANVALVRNNARLAADIARAYASDRSSEPS